MQVIALVLDPVDEGGWDAITVDEARTLKRWHSANPQGLFADIAGSYPDAVRFCDHRAPPEAAELGFQHDPLPENFRRFRAALAAHKARGGDLDDHAGVREVEALLQLAFAAIAMAEGAFLLLTKGAEIHLKMVPAVGDEVADPPLLRVSLESKRLVIEGADGRSTLHWGANAPWVSEAIRDAYNIPGVPVWDGPLSVKDWCAVGQALLRVEADARSFIAAPFAPQRLTPEFDFDCIGPHISNWPEPEDEHASYRIEGEVVGAPDDLVVETYDLRRASSPRSPAHALAVDLAATHVGLSVANLELFLGGLTQSTMLLYLSSGGGARFAWSDGRKHEVEVKFVRDDSEADDSPCGVVVLRGHEGEVPYEMTVPLMECEGELGSAGLLPVFGPDVTDDRLRDLGLAITVMGMSGNRQCQTVTRRVVTDTFDVEVSAHAAL